MCAGVWISVLLLVDSDVCARERVMLSGYFIFRIAHFTVAYKMMVVKKNPKVAVGGVGRTHLLPFLEPSAKSALLYLFYVLEFKPKKGVRLHFKSDLTYLGRELQGG